jgi:hypothetical protein
LLASFDGCGALLWSKSPEPRQDVGRKLLPDLALQRNKPRPRGPGFSYGPRAAGGVPGFQVARNIAVCQNVIVGFRNTLSWSGYRRHVTVPQTPRGTSVTA